MTRVRCDSCGELHDLAEMDIGYQWPDAYLAVPLDERARRCRVTDDLAEVDGTTHFLRAVLEIPVRGEDHIFAWGVWVRVAERDFRRYVSLYEKHGQGSEPPFRGWIANQLPGYAQTLGVPVTVQLIDARQRPALTVADAGHALAVEQRDGVFLERVLEVTSPLLHRGRIVPPGAPYLATIARDGWTLDDAVERFQRRDGVIWMPPESIRGALQVGHWAKLLVRIEASDALGCAARHVERMWAEVDHCHADGAARYSGWLSNQPHVRGLTHKGMRMWFGPEHIIDVAYADHTILSQGVDVLRCAHHGPSQTTYVCQHLPRGRGLGFHHADDPGNPRPDAWCDACEAVLDEEGEWNDRSEAFAAVTVLCGSCYDAAETRNRH